jgi:hypothetical protein
MAEHIPRGCKIVRSEEVIEGRRVQEKTRKSEFQTEPSLHALNQNPTCQAQPARTRNCASARQLGGSNSSPFDEHPAFAPRRECLDSRRFG